jgi:hypothetical protein
MSPVAVSQTQRSYAVNGDGEGGNVEVLATDARFSDNVAPFTASQLPEIGWVFAGQICAHSTPAPGPHAV